MTPPSEPLTMTAEEWSDLCKIVTAARPTSKNGRAILQTFAELIALRERLRVAEAERDRETQLRREAEAHNTELRQALNIKPYPDDLEGAEAERDAARSECERLREAIAWYADPETWEQVDLLGRCPLSEDRDDEGLLGMRARAALAPSPLAQATEPRGSGNPGGGGA